MEFLFLTCRRGRELSCILPQPEQIPPRETSAGTERHHSHSIPFSCHCREPLHVRYESIHALTPFYFLSFDTQCSDTSKLTPPWGSTPSTSTIGIFSLEVGNTDLLSLCIPAYSNRLRLTASVRKPDNIKRQIAKLPVHSHMTAPGVTGCRNTHLSSLSCLPG